ncbi:MAG TPA: autotransporter domain-containing protein [Herbaspirillum sp.]
MDEPQVAPLTEYVRQLGKKHPTWEFPNFDPLDGGCGAGVVSTSAATILNGGGMAGGNGGKGADDLAGGGGGGGDALVTTAGAITLTNIGSMNGGDGGAGGGSAGGNFGGGGGGGAGVDLGIGGNSITNLGSISGGTGGASLLGGAANGRGGAGITTFGNDIINNTGSIIAGVAGDGVTRADAILFNGANNQLKLQGGSNIVGNLELSNGGGATISALNGGLSLSNDIVLGSASDLSFDTSVAGLTVAGIISGAGTVTANGGSGSLIITGNNTYTGITTINAGNTLQVGNNAASGSLGTGAVADAGTLIFNRIDAVIVANAISGGGVLNQSGTGTTILTGANNYSGATTVTAGTLQIGNGGTVGSLGTGAVLIDTGAILSFNRSDTVTAINDIGGTGTLNKNGSGNLILTGTNSFSGNTNVNIGTLSVNGSIAGDITVNSGAALGGSGSVGNVDLLSGGILAPGNSIGTLTVNDNLNFAAGSIYRVEANAAGSADRTDVLGNLAINGGTVDVQAGAGSFAQNTTYTILTNLGTRTGTFAGVTSNLAFLTPTLSYDASHVFLNLARNTVSFSNVAATPNQRAVAGTLENVAGGASGDMSTVLTAVTGLSVGQARAAYDAMSGAGLVALRRSAPAFANNFGNQLRARMDATGMSASVASFDGVQLAANDHINDLMPALAQAPQQQYTLAGGIPQTQTDKRGLWVRAYGNDQSTDSDGNAASNRIRNAGISVGFDTRISDSLVIGAALTHGSADIDTDNNESGNSRGNAAALYASYASGGWNFNGSATLARNDNSMQRRMTFGGIDRTASSDFYSNTVALYGEATHDVPMAGWTLQPLAGLSLSRNMTDGFTETGADALNLQVAGQNVNSAKTLFGAKAIFDLDKVQLQPRLIWGHEFGNINSEMTAQLQGAPTQFGIAGVDLPRDTLIAGMTIVGHSSGQLSLFADMQGEFSSQQTNLALLVGLRASW